MTYGLLFNTLFPAAVIAQTLTLLPAIGGAAVLTSVALGIHRIKLKAYESRAILKTALFSAVVTAFYGVLAKLSDSAVPGAATVLFGIILFLMSVAVRFAMLHILIWVYRKGQTMCRVLIYGAGTTGMQLATALRAHETIDPVAFVDDNPGLHQMTVAGLQVYPASQIAKWCTAGRSIGCCWRCPRPRRRNRRRSRASCSAWGSTCRRCRRSPS